MLPFQRLRVKIKLSWVDRLDPDCYFNAPRYNDINPGFKVTLPVRPDPDNRKRLIKEISYGTEEVDSNCNYMLLGPRLQQITGKFGRVGDESTELDVEELKIRFYSNMETSLNNNKHVAFVRQKYVVMGRNRIQEF